MDRDDLIELLRKSLRIEVKTGSEYNGGMDGDSLYSKCQTVQLILDGEVISEANL